MRTRTAAPSGHSSAASTRCASTAAATASRPSERSEKGVALRVDLVAVVLGERSAEDLRVPRLDGVVPLAQLLLQPGRPFDIAEEEGDRAGRALSHLDGSRNPIPPEKKRGR
jgi:hypothetical protein